MPHLTSFVVGLTGGIGSGKSTATSCFKKRGAVVIDADEISRGLTAHGSPVVQELAQEFGPKILQTDGLLDRAALAAIVFSDTKALEKLNAIMHPKIRAEAQARIARIDPDQIVVYDMPLLVETDSAQLCDVVVVVDLEPAQQVQRLVENRGMGVEQAESRIRNQTSRELRNQAATWVIDNSGTMKDFDQACTLVWQEIVKRALKVRL